MGITVACCVADLREVNIDISGLEADIASLNGVVNGSKTKIETNVSNIEVINSTIGRSIVESLV
jgi:hypothetical protein